MRLLTLIVCMCLPSLGNAAERFGGWVENELGYAPFLAQSIGWDMPEPSFTVADPHAPARGQILVFEKADTRTWVVGIFDDATSARLAGLALVWADDFVARAVSHGVAQTDSGFVAFQTLEQLLEEDVLQQSLQAQLAALSPGPRLVEHPAGTLFPAGNGQTPGGCFETVALYNDDDALIGLVVLFQSSNWTDVDVTVCGPLTT